MKRSRALKLHEWLNPAESAAIHANPPGLPREAAPHQRSELPANSALLRRAQQLRAPYCGPGGQEFGSARSPKRTVAARDAGNVAARGDEVDLRTPSATVQVSSKPEVVVPGVGDHLSRYVRHAAEGGKVVVTAHRRPVARLCAIDAADPLVGLGARGLVREPERPKRARSSIGRIAANDSVSDLVAEKRR